MPSFEVDEGGAGRDHYLLCGFKLVGPARLHGSFDLKPAYHDDNWNLLFCKEVNYHIDRQYLKKVTKRTMPFFLSIAIVLSVFTCVGVQCGISLYCNVFICLPAYRHFRQLLGLTFIL